MAVYVGAGSRATKYVGAGASPIPYVGAGSLFGASPPAYVGLAPFVSGTTSCSPDFTSSGRASGDLLFIFVSTANRAVTTPSGWTLLALTPASGTADAAGAVRLTTFWKISSGSETTVALTITSAGFSSACGLVVRGVDPASVSNLLQNSTDLTSGTYWHVINASIAAGNLLTITGSTNQGNNGIYTDSFTTLTSGATYTFLYEVKASATTKTFADNIYTFAGGVDVDYTSPDNTATTSWQRFVHTATVGASVTASNVAFLPASTLANTSVYLRNVMLVSGTAAADLAYVPTLTTAGSSIAGISNAVGQTQTATTAFSWVDALAYKDNCLVINVLANDRDAASTSNLSSVTNAALTNLTLRLDQTVTTGAGGGLAVITGNLATAGSTGNTTATNAASNTNASITLVLAA